MMAKLFAFRKKQLHPKTNPDDGLAILDVLKNRLDKPVLFQVLHTLPECAHSGENKFLRGLDDVWVSRDFGRDAYLFKGLLD
jgi:hypothetical protein